MDETGEASSETVAVKEGTGREQILERARSNIERKRSTQLTVEGLKPNTEYQLRSFPFGTSIRAMVFVGSDRLKEMYPGEADKLDDIFETLGDDTYRSQYRHVIHEGFAALVPEEPLLWESTSRSGEEDYRFSDEVIGQLKAENGGVDGAQGHCVFWPKRVHLPENLRKADKGQVVEALFNKRLEVIRRYPEVKRWVLVNEPVQHTPRVEDGVDRNELVLNPRDDIDIYVELFKKAKEANPEAKLIVNEYNILSREKLDDYIAFISELRAKGAPIDGIGVQGHVGSPDEYSIERVQESLDKLARLGLPITVTEFDVPGTAFENEADRAQYFEDMLTIFYGNENVEGVYIWGIQDKTHWRGKERAGLYDENFNPNEAGTVLEEKQKDWKTETTVTTDNEGRAQFVGFPGVYRITDKTIGKSFPKIL
jgi:GH35 family endo-1,4-beta-xylanase